MGRWLDLEGWERREHYELFLPYDNPYFNVCADVDVTALKRVCDAVGGPSFFLASLWLSTRAANAVEPLRYRLQELGVWVYDHIHFGSTVLRPDRTFAFAYFEDHEVFGAFLPAAQAVVERIRNEREPLDPGPDRDDLIHYSVLPWVSFTSFSHARRWGTDDSVPKIVFGAFRESGGRWAMPVSVEVHHALVDGLHVGEYYRGFQALLDDAGELLTARP